MERSRLRLRAPPPAPNPRCLKALTPASLPSSTLCVTGIPSPIHIVFEVVVAPFVFSSFPSILFPGHSVRLCGTPLLSSPTKQLPWPPCRTSYTHTNTHAQRRRRHARTHPSRARRDATPLLQGAATISHARHPPPTLLRGGQVVPVTATHGVSWC